jgi:hypothetical protein
VYVRTTFIAAIEAAMDLSMQDAPDATIDTLVFSTDASRDQASSGETPSLCASLGLSTQAKEWCTSNVHAFGALVRHLGRQGTLVKSAVAMILDLETCSLLSAFLPHDCTAEASPHCTRRSPTAAAGAAAQGTLSGAGTQPPGAARPYMCFGGAQSDNCLSRNETSQMAALAEVSHTVLEVHGLCSVSNQ